MGSWPSFSSASNISSRSCFSTFFFLRPFFRTLFFFSGSGSGSGSGGSSSQMSYRIATLSFFGSMISFPSLRLYELPSCQIIHRHRRGVGGDLGDVLRFILHIGKQAKLADARHDRFPRVLNQRPRSPGPISALSGKDF